ncbi:hypothetical protein AQJ27_50750 [Streptomyces olivochromogenes]|nr:hypothetical protein AQJ27_50750 [Streptomyces olivochromogenes]
MADAVPAQAHDGRVVLQVVVVGVDDRRDQSAGGLVGMQRGGAHDQVRQIEAVGVALQRAVGQHHQPVARLQAQRLDPVGVGDLEAERQIGFWNDLPHLPVPHAQWPRVAGVDELGLAVEQADAQELAGDVALAAVIAHGLPAEAWSIRA